MGKWSRWVFEDELVGRGWERGPCERLRGVSGSRYGLIALLISPHMSIEICLNASASHDS